MGGGGEIAKDRRQKFEFESFLQYPRLVTDHLNCHVKNQPSFE